MELIPPHSQESEQGVIGCILLAPQESILVCIENGVMDGMFYDLRHQTIFDQALRMHDAGSPIDLITLQQALKDAGKLEYVGGLPYLATLPDMVSSSHNLPAYLDTVKSKYLLRKLIQTCSGTMTQAYTHDGDVATLLDQAERDMMAVSQRVVKDDRKTSAQLVQSALYTLEEMHQRQGAVMGISSGFPGLDRMTMGFNGGEMIVLAARPSMGKTSLAMNIVEHVAVQCGVPVGVFSLEMTAESLMLRMLCSMARVNIRRAGEGFIGERDFPRLTGAAGRLHKAPIHIDDTSALPIMQLRARARRMVQRHGVQLLVVDYLQLVKGTGRYESRQQEIADISSGLKALAKELNIPVLVLSQLNRDLEKTERKPRLSDLRESGSIEQDADLVGMLYRDESEEGGVNLLIAKQRNGPTGDVPLTFLGDYTRFESRAKIHESDVP